MSEEQLPDDMIIDFSIREAMGEGNVFAMHMDMRRKNLPMTRRRREKMGGMKEGPLMRRWTRWLN